METRINAQNAREISYNAVKSEIDQILIKIREKANLGELSIEIPYNQCSTATLLYLKFELDFDWFASDGNLFISWEPGKN